MARVNGSIQRDTITGDINYLQGANDIELAKASDISGFVPYTGATGDVDLGTNTLSTEAIEITNGAGTTTLSSALSNQTQALAPLSGTIPIFATTPVSGGLIGWSGTTGAITNLTAIPSATTATTQSPGDNSTKIATTAYVAANTLSNPMTNIGDLIQGTTSGAPVRLAAVAIGNALISGGVNTASSWGKIGLTTHVSGTLPIANGGTGSATQNFVDLTTTQSIGGAKTFTTGVVAPGLNIGNGNSTTAIALNLNAAGQVLTGTTYVNARFLKNSSDNYGIGIGYVDGSQTGVIYPETGGAASNLLFRTYTGSAWAQTIYVDGAAQSTAFNGSIGAIGMIGTAISSNTNGVGLYQANDATQRANVRAFGTSASGTIFGQAVAGWASFDTNVNTGLLIGTTASAAVKIGTNNTLAVTIGTDQSVTTAGTLGYGGIANSVASGTYTPTARTGTNVISATAGLAHYIRIGNQVQVSGYLSSVITSGTGQTVIGISLPSGLTSNFTATADANGVSNGINPFGGSVVIGDGWIQGDTTNDDLAISFNAFFSLSGQQIHYVANYTIK